MGRFVEGADRSQITLFPDCLEDLIGEDNPVRAIDVFVDELDLAELGFDGVDPEVTGRPSYHPSVLLKLYIYGYLNRVQSSRRLEREAGRNVEVMWLTGRLAPDHKTMADFRKDNGRAIRQVCAQFVALCRTMGLLTQASVAIDGSKFKAVNNRDKDFTRAKMELRLRARPPKASYGAIKKHPGQRRGAVTQIRLLPDGPSGGTGRRDVQRTGTGLSVLFLLTSRQRPGPPRACLRGSDPAVADEGSPNVQAHRYPTDYPVVRSRREDGIVVIPAKLKGAAAHKVVDPLLTKGLVEEIRANGKLPVWRRDDSEGPFALRITKRGLHAIQVEPEGHAQDGTDVGRAKASKSSSAKRRQKPRAKASGRSSKRPSNPPGSPAEPRAGSKLALIVKMLERTRGSTIDDLTAATSWLPHTTRAVITSLRNKGYRVETERNRDHKIIYRIAAKKSPGQTRRAS